MKILGFQEMQLAPGAYLFYGQEMIGKKTYALELASSITNSADRVMVLPDIASVRDMKRFLTLSPLYGSYKVAIVDNAHEMGHEAQNALLKVLEEPNASSIIILVTSQPEQLLPTITSRCQQNFFPPHSPETIRQYLEDKKLTEEQKTFLISFCNGSIGLLAEVDHVKSFIQEYADLAKADIGKRFDIAKKLAEDETLPKKILFWMLYLRSKKIYAPLRGLLALHETVSQPQYSKQLALENFMLQLS